jgi:hypothetical protein
MKKSSGLRLILLSLTLLALSMPSWAIEPKRPWTVLVYLNGDNNLNPTMLNEIELIERAGSSNDVNVVVQYDGTKEKDSKRFLARPGRGTKDSVIFAQDVEYDMGSTATLADFLAWGIENFPSDKIALVVFGHGRGILNIPQQDGAKFGKSNSHAMTLASSPDETSGSHMEEADVAEAIGKVLAEKRKGRKLDLFAYNSCLMGNIEVLREIATVADYMLASEYSIVIESSKSIDVYRPPTGLSVHHMSSYLMDVPSSDSRSAGAAAVKGFYEDYKDYALIDYFNGTPSQYFPTTMALYDLSNLSETTALVAAMAADIRDALAADKRNVDRLYEEVLKGFMIDSMGYMDLGLVARITQRAIGSPHAAKILEALASRESLILNTARINTRPEISGLSIFFPAFAMDDADFKTFSGFYSKTTFAKETGWDKVNTEFRQNYFERSFEINYNMMERFLSGAKVQVSYTDDFAYNEHHLFSVLGWLQFYKALLTGRYDRADRQIDLLMNSKVRDTEISSYLKELRLLLDEQIKKTSNPMDKRHLIILESKLTGQ